MCATIPPRPLRRPSSTARPASSRQASSPRAASTVASTARLYASWVVWPVSSASRADSAAAVVAATTRPSGTRARPGARARGRASADRWRAAPRPPAARQSSRPVVLLEPEQRQRDERRIGRLAALVPARGLEDEPAALERGAVLDEQAPERLDGEPARALGDLRARGDRRRPARGLEPVHDLAGDAQGRGPVAEGPDLPLRIRRVEPLGAGDVVPRGRDDRPRPDLDRRLHQLDVEADERVGRQPRAPRGGARPPSSARPGAPTSRRRGAAARGPRPRVTAARPARAHAPPPRTRSAAARRPRCARAPRRRARPGRPSRPPRARSARGRARSGARRRARGGAARRSAGAAGAVDDRAQQRGGGSAVGPRR